MIIACPSCLARYELAGGPGAIPSEGRSMRCGRCGNIWQALPVEPPPEILSPDLVWGEIVSEREQQDERDTLEDGAADATSVARLVEDAADDRKDMDEEHSASGIVAQAHRAAREVAQQNARRSSQSGSRLRGFMLGVTLALLVAVLHFRTDIVRVVPSSAALYDLVGLTVNLRGLDFRDVTPRRIFEDGLPVLIIEGEVVNVRNVEVAVPALRIAVRGPSREELYAWTIEPRQSVVAAGESMSFRTRLAAPPAGSRDVKVRFVERTRQPAGIRP